MLFNLINYGKKQKQLKQNDDVIITDTFRIAVETWRIRPSSVLNFNRTSATPRKQNLNANAYALGQPAVESPNYSYTKYVSLSKTRRDVHIARHPYHFSRNESKNKTRLAWIASTFLNRNRSKNWCINWLTRYKKWDHNCCLNCGWNLKKG
jgi:hypothetical protein